MSVLIKGMEMPKNGEAIILFSDGSAELFDRRNIEIIDFPKSHRNRVIEVPPHGRLIDADKVKKTIRPITEEDDFEACTFRTVKELMRNHIDAAPTIIEAEVGEA